MRKSPFLFYIGCKFAFIPFRFPIEIAFSAVQEREFVFRLKCKVHKKFAPLFLNVKTKGYAVRLALIAKNVDGKEMLLPLERDANRTVSFGEVRSNHLIVNPGTIRHMHSITNGLHVQLLEIACVLKCN